MIPVALSDGFARISGTIPALALSVISQCSGRKRWRGSLGVDIEATPANITMLRESNLPFVFKDDGTLAKIEALRAPAPDVRATSRARASYKPKQKLYDYQTKELQKGWHRPAFGFLFEMGLGKSCVTICNAAWLFLDKKISAVLIIAPNGVHEQWADEQIPAHLGDSIKRTVDAWKKKPIKFKKRPETLAFLCINIEAIRTDGGAKCVNDFIETHGNVMCIVDESHRIKTYAAQQTRAAIAIGNRCTYRRILTGTPLAKSPEDFFSQFYFLDPMILGHKYLSSFRGRYCIMGGYQGRVVVGHKRLDELYGLIAPHSSRLTKEEALDLPPKNYTIAEYAPSDKTMRHYKEIKREFMTQLDSGEIVSVANAASGMIRLQQIVSGYYPGESGIEDISSERIDTLLDVIEQRSGPVVIWARFVEDVKRIDNALKKCYGKEFVVTYNGDTAKKDRAENVKKFLSGRARFFVGNAAAGGTGLNLQGDCQTVIYYSNDFSALSRWQSEDRVHRIGMRHPVTYIDIVARGSLDRFILANLRRKKELSSLTLDDIRKALR